MKRQKATKAVSVGSPTAVSPLMAPSLHNTLSLTKSFTASGVCLASSSSHTLPLTYAFCTVIRFCVSVPVLSEQITDTQPKPSTARKFLMIAFSRAIFCVPIAKPMVTIELRASGIAATASATANIKDSAKPMSRHTPRPNTMAQMTMIIIDNFFEKSSRLRCNGVAFSCADSIKSAIFPISVCIPVAVTSTTARP